MIEVGMEWQVIDTPIQLKEVSAPATPFAGKVKLYAKDKSSVSGLYWMDDAGAEYDLGQITSVSGTANRLTYWSSATALGSMAAGTSGQFLKSAGSSAVPAWAAPDHGSELGGLTDDDHTQYALLAGRSGGQTLIGGTASGNNLKFSSSSHGTKGGIFLGDTGASASIHPTITGNYNQVYKNATAEGTELQIANNAVADAAAIGALSFGTHGASNSDKRAALISCKLSGLGSTHPAGQLEFYTRIAGGTTFNTNLILSATGALGVGGANYGTSGQALVSAGSAAVPVWTSLDHGTHLAGLADDDHTQYVLRSILTTNGDLFTRTAGAIARLGIGSDGDVLTVSSGAPAWAVSSAGMSIGGTVTSGTANRILYVGAGPVLAESANLTFDGSDFALGSGIRARMASQNRFRFLNSMARAYRITSNQTIANNTRTIMLFNTEEFDTDTIHDNSSSSGRLTAKLAGKYIATCSIRWASNSTGGRLATIKKNGTTNVSEHSQYNLSGNHLLLTGSPVIVSMAVNDYIEVEVFQDSGGDLDVVLDDRTQFAMAYIGE